MWKEKVFQSSKRMAVPIMTHPGIEIIGKNVYDAVTDGKVHFEAIKALSDRYPSSVCTVIMDLTVEAEAFGASVEFYKNDIPTVIGRLLPDMQAVERLEIPDLGKGRLPQYLLANQLAVEHIKDKPIWGGMIGPFSLAGRLYDMSEFMMACYCEPEGAKVLLQKCTDFLINYCSALKQQGVSGVVLAEPAAGLLSNEGCEEFSSFYVRQIVKRLQDDNFMIVLHNCGNTGHCTPAMISTEASGLHFGNSVDMVDTLKECPKDVLVMGNLNPVSLFKSGTSDDVKKATRDLLERTSEFPNFIISTGCDVPPSVSLQNIEAFYAAIDEFNRLR